MSAPCSKQRIRSMLFLLLGIAFIGVPAAHAISGGSNASSLQGQVQLFEFDNGVATYQCTGSLIAPDWVLTAKHCITDTGITALNGAVYVGTYHLQQGQAFFLQNIYSNNVYDVALLQLRSSVTQPGLVMPYGRGVLTGPTAAHQAATALVQGWGSTTPPPPITLASYLQASVQEIQGEYSPGVLSYTSLRGVTQKGDSGAGFIYFGTVCAVLVNGGEATETDAVATYIQQVTGVAPAPPHANGTQACDPPPNPRPCDIYADNGTPCVAAYSTVRALYAHPTANVRLYQITRSSDGTSFDILDGVDDSYTENDYADAAAQDSFCANATCIISKIYDQSGNRNDLTIEGPGGNKNSPDNGAVANALPIEVHGHKVYGVSVTQGVGYRNNNTVGVVRNVGIQPGGQAAEGMYMVTSGKNVNGGCCFDFGNAETNSDDNGAGRMDALNFGTFCGFPPCSGPGPWVEADLENGQFMGNRNNPNNPSISSNFVTAMLKNNGISNFALKGGNAQSGTLTTGYDGPLPTGYRMQQEGAVVLGTGGDNSATGVGSFFEGAMTEGYPLDLAESAVQANIVTAGYSGNSNPTNGEPPSYTGPSDPNGPGPQDGLEGPADEQPNDLMGSKPGMAFYRGKIYAAFQSNDSRHELYVTSTANGGPYPTATGYPDIHIGSAPVVAEFKHALYVAFQADDASHKLFVTSSSTGSDFPAATGYSNVLMGSAPAMAAFRHQLFVAFQSNDSSHGLYVTASNDGRDWPTAVGVPNVQIGSAPALAVFRSQMFVAFRANDSSNDVWVASSTDGFHFSSKRIAGPTKPQTMGPDSSPALVVSNNVLYCIYGAQDLANEMLVMASTDGVTWQGPKAYLDVQMGASGPGASVTNDGFTVGFQSNDSRNVLFTSYKHTEALSYSGPNSSGGPQDGFASPAVDQGPDVMGSKPSFTSVNNNILVAFQANDGTDDLFVSTTQIGNPYPTATAYPNIQLGSAPTIVAANPTPIGGDKNVVFMAFQADDGSDNLFVTTSPDGGHSWPTATAVPNVKIGGAPAMVGSNGTLYLAFQADDPSHQLFITTSSDGQNWPPATAVPNVRIGSDPAIAILNGTIYVAFRADDDSDGVWIASSSDGAHFTSQRLPGQMGGNSSPALVAANGTLYYIYSANDQDSEMLVMASTDGTNWQGPEVYPGVQVGPSGPGASQYLFIITSPSPILKTGITAGFQSNDAYNILFTTTKTIQ
ncbi:Endo-1,4-beta-xylanase A precursor [Acidisarcina polymorpha]|uniref:Endo-1,4-beta-xylanase A n=1 Tax=Acidisarcina polymorpha TaxID=2211140 RepID=A0A2Z5GAL1_9BACT|nr:arabinofuranosidase catalytic domain-containing protein [Acidisarcina polymorpha]AXC15636.1 Endo-1,4-beta-xylanase A precursor [Acidisarcina polymorpha]